MTKPPSPQLAGLALVVALELVGAASAPAQVRVATLDELRRSLSPGDVITVVPAGGDSIRGKVLRVGDTDLDIRPEYRKYTGQQRRPDFRIPLSTIQSLERPRDSSRNGALIGAAVGAGFVGAMYVYSFVVDHNEIDEWGARELRMAGMYAGIGALVGWAIDFGDSKPHVRFDRRSTAATRVKVAPLLSRKPGLAVVVSF